MREVIARSGQSLIDVVLQETGSIEGVLEVARNNNVDVDYCFDKEATIEMIEDTSYYSKKIKQAGLIITTGIL